MQPQELTYEICRCYVQDQTDVNEALIARIMGLTRSRSLAQLASCTDLFDGASHSIADMRFLRQISAFFKKNSAFVQKDVTVAAAEASYKEAEEACSATNLRLKPYFKRETLLSANCLEYLYRMRSYIGKVLGDFNLFLTELPELVRITPGATSDSSRRNSLPQMKMRMRLFATRRASRYLKALYAYYGFREPRIRPTHRNRVELVPKNWKTDRTIACEPEGNLPLQLAFDTYAKRRLRRYGINLSDQSRNQRLAKHASIYDDLVTVDFSKASDTIAYNTVSWLLPEDWFGFLDDVRTPSYRGAFGEGHFSKFSSMGNGSTFTLETLIFASACHAVGSEEFSVYGDDVIIEREYYEEFVELTSFLGFTVNMEKSYASGPFRESCGKDYFNGIDVTPAYISGIDDRKANLCHLVNSMLGIATADGRLVALMDRIITDYNLPYVPFNSSTTSGVWIDPGLARTLGILVHEDGIDWFRAYQPKYKRRYFIDSRGYYLWFLSRRAIVLFGGPWETMRSFRATETSWVPVFTHKYVRGWVRLVQPEATASHLYWWKAPSRPVARRPVRRVGGVTK